MKTIKIIILTILVALLSYGIYKIMPDDPPRPDDVVIPSEPNLEWAEKHIDSVFQNVQQGDFGSLPDRRSKLENAFKSSNWSEQARKTVNLIILRRYTDRFIMMAYKEFEDNTWPHVSKIKEISSALSNNDGQTSDTLRKIDKICDMYIAVCSYNARVKKLCDQSPSDYYSKWNVATTRSLLQSTPSATAPVDHTQQFAKSRKSAVQKRLYEAHLDFLKELLQVMDEYLNNNSRQCDVVRKTVANEIREFQNNAYSLYGNLDGKDGRRAAQRLLKEIDDNYKCEKYYNEAI